jgi:hypothetical protein
MAVLVLRILFLFKNIYCMRLFVSKITLVFYLLQALVPIGYMPNVLADDNGFLMLCPSKGGSVTWAAQVAEPVMAQNMEMSGHHHGHHQISAMSDAKESHNNHQMQSNDCDYATASAGQDFNQTGVLYRQSYSGLPVLNMTLEAEAEIALRLRKQQSRAPPITVS